MNLKNIFVLGFLISNSIFAESKAVNVIPHNNGVTIVDYNGNGKSGIIVSGHRENYNAHSFEVVSFYIKSASGELNIIPLSLNEKESFSLSVSGGADCVLHDFRLLRGNGKTPATLIKADREFGETYVSSELVTFTYYSLAENNESVAGLPPYVFSLLKEVKSKQKYCDVGEAFKKELGVIE